MRNFKSIAFIMCLMWCASGVSGETVSPKSKINISDLKFPSVFGDLSKVPRRIDTVNNFREITITPDGRFGHVTWSYQDELGSIDNQADFLLHGASIGCPCCPSPMVDSTRDSNPCCVPCDSAIFIGMRSQSEKSDPILLVGQTNVLVQSTSIIPSEGYVVVSALCYVDRDFNDPKPSTLEIGIISEGGLPFLGWEKKELEPAVGAANAQALISMEKTFPVSEGNTTIKLSARSVSENSTDVAQLRILFVTFVPYFKESASK